MARQYDGLQARQGGRVAGRHVAVLAGLLVALVAGYLAWDRAGGDARGQQAAGPQAAGPEAVADGQVILAVLPLAGEGNQAMPVESDSPDALIGALKGDAVGDGFNDGLSMHFAAALAQFERVRVISPGSALQLRGPGMLASVAGNRVGATHVLQGKARREGGTLLLDLALVRVADAATLWFERYQRPYDQLFALQDEVVSQVAAALKARRLQAPRGTQDARPGSGNLAAYEAVLRGDAAHARRDGAGLRQALAAYEQAVALDPDYGHAYARLALARIGLATRFPEEAGDVREQGERARRDAGAALRLAPDSAEARKAQAAWLAGVALDPSGAMHETMRALELGPQDAELLHSLALQQTAFGQLKDAAATLRRALALDPLSPLAHYNLGGVYLGLNDYPQAEHALAQALALRPDLSVVRAFQSIAVFQQNRLDEALKLAGEETDALWRSYALALVHWARGERAEADAQLQALVSRYPTQAATQIADIHAQRDDEAAMFKWLEAARKAGDPGIVEIRYLPFVSRYADDPRFVALARELDLVPAPAGTRGAGGTR